jgi:hypothetical protein
MLSIFWSYKMGHDASLPNVSSMIFFSKYYTTITVLFDQTYCETIDWQGVTVTGYWIQILNEQ